MRRRQKLTNIPACAHGQPKDERPPAHEPANRQQGQAAALHTLQAAIQDGLNSGVSDKTLRQIWAEAEQRHQMLTSEWLSPSSPAVVCIIPQC